MNGMARWFPPIFLLVNGLIYAALTLMFVVAPLSWFSRLGIVLQDPLGYTELKTMYIGLMGSLAVFSLLAIPLKSLREAALLFSLISYCALALVRSWGIWVDAVYDDFTLQLLYAEIISALAAGIAWRFWRQTNGYGRQWPGSA